MAGLAAAVRVLLWKNWRVKQRESRLNRGRARPLFPALLADVLLPLTLLLLLVAKLCELNTPIGVDQALVLEPTQMHLSASAASSYDDDAAAVALERKGRQLVAAGVRPVNGALLVTALPLLLARTNQRLAVLDRPLARAFVRFLDREYPGAVELGIPAFREMTTMLPFDDTMPMQEIDELLRTVAMRSGSAVYAALDLRAPRVDDASALELMAFLRRGVGAASPDNDQLRRYFTRSLIVNDTSRRFPGILPLQAEANLFLRDSRYIDLDNTNSGPVDEEESGDVVHPTPKAACTAVHTMLLMSELTWADLAPTSPLGGSVAECEAAVRGGGLSRKLRHFLARLTRRESTPEGLHNLRVAALPKRPQTTVSGLMEGSIVLCMAYLFLWPYVRLVRDVVLEKEKQLKEYLLIMGLRPMALLLSWFLLYLGASVAVSAIAVALLSGTMFAASHASVAHFFLLLVTFAGSILLFGLSITPMFNQAKTAAACASLAYFVLGAGPFIRALAGDDTMDASPVLTTVVSGLEAVSSPVVFMAALRAILGLDALSGAVRPIAWAAVRAPCVKMALQSAGYLLLGWYLENVFPRPYGVQQRWYFVAQPSYWFPSLSVRRSERLSGESAELMGLEELAPSEFDDTRDETLRELPLREYVRQFKPVLLVNALSKRYPNGKEALQRVSFGVKKGEIFGLLGPNGAGKSTTLSILCGMLSPTEGDAIVGGAVSVAQSPEMVRKSLSVCFQQNILFDDLTVDEHVRLVCALKHALGVQTLAPEMLECTLRQFGLSEKRAALSKTLSGGQKRKLSLVLALLDDARVVLLDEPTAGMDLRARLDTWDALRRAVRHRAVILTTHSMQEAQTLCENIGIVADGRLKCCGSSLFLREHFGVGYKLTLVHPHDANDRENSEGNERRVSTAALLETVRQFVPNATLASDSKWETRIQLTDGHERNFAPLFEALEALRGRQEIRRYALQATDLEDVFVRVTEGEAVYHHARDDAPDAHESEPKVSSSSSYGATADSASAFARSGASAFRVAIVQLRALIVKRGKLALRDRKMLFAQYVWPLAVFAILLAAVQHVSFDGRSVETLTVLPRAAAGSSFYFVSSTSELAHRVREILEHVDHAVYREAASEQHMLDAIVSRENDTSFFAAAYISRLHWPDSNATSSSIGGGFEFSLFYNRSIARSLPVGLEVLAEALAVKAGVIEEQTFGVEGINGGGGQSEVPLGSADSLADLVSRLILAYYLLLTVSSIASYYITPVVKERESGLKRQQYLHLASRAASRIYWASNLLVDFAAYFVAAALVAIAVHVFSSSVAGDVLLVWWLALLAFGAATLPFTYLLSLVFASHSSAQAFLSYASLFQILATMVIATMSTVPSLCVKVYAVSYVLQALPFYTLGTLVTNVATVQFAPAREQCLRLSEQLASDQDMALNLTFSPPPSVWDWSVSGSSFAALLSSAVLYSLLLLVFDHWQMYPTIVSRRFKQAWERTKRALGFSASDIGYDSVPSMSDNIERAKRSLVDVVGVTKVFNPKKGTHGAAPNSESSSNADTPAVLNPDGQVVALNDVSFSVEQNDCVALLGVNGSGKSTMFEILTAGTAPTRGRALIDGFDATLQPKEASEKYGYCPQTNILFGELTVREHLELFHRLRSRERVNGVECERATVDALMRRLDLLPVENTATAHLSGGNKRRVMLALALLSDHVALLLLDEPSAGVDVVARRLMWRVLHEKRQSRHRASCLFTTHSMEEAEAVCANAVVLFKGTLVWCGSIPDLKQHASRGVSISIRLDSAAVLAPERVAEYVNLVHDVMDREVPGARAFTERGQVRSEDLERAWALCRQWYRPVSADEASAGALGSPPPNRLRREEWFAGALTRVRHQDAADSSRSDGSGAVAIAEFVREWLIQEDLATLEHALFTQQIARVSGEAVKVVDDAASASGSSMTAAYETVCTDAFGLAALFDVLERNKSRFAVAQYSVSELSLERVFEQFT